MLKTFTVTFPTEGGCFGRECNSAKCGRYFKVHENSLRDEMYCPDCGDRFQKDALFTRDQLNHAEELFPGLVLNSLRNPLTAGTFRFDKGESKAFVGSSSKCAGR
jgi:hypothetical protein